jgi:hypothetical protein
MCGMCCGQWYNDVWQLCTCAKGQLLLLHPLKHGIRAKNGLFLAYGEITQLSKAPKMGQMATTSKKQVWVMILVVLGYKFGWYHP